MVCESYWNLHIWKRLIKMYKLCSNCCIKVRSVENHK